MKNPLVDSQDDEPLFNLNNHDQFQLLITSAKLKNSDFNVQNLVETLSRALKNMLLTMPLDDTTDKITLLKALDKPDLDVYRLVVTYLNDQIRNANNPLLVRDAISSFITENYELKNLGLAITL